MTVWTAQDRSMSVAPGNTIETAWIDIDACRIGNRDRMAVGDVSGAFSKLLCLGDCAPWPCMVGHWDGADRFVVCDGRHEYIASLMLGRARVFVAWLVKGEAA